MLNGKVYADDTQIIIWYNSIIYSFALKQQALNSRIIFIRRRILFMKKCIHCGAPIKWSAVAFCPKCNKPLKKKPPKKRPVQSKQKKPPLSASKPATQKRLPPAKPIPQQIKKAAPPRKPKIKKIRQPKNKKSWLSFLLKPKKIKISDPDNVTVVNPMDENYDGYYDDKPTDDNELIKDALEPELIKRIIFISAGAGGIVILAIVIMMLL